MKTTFHRLWAVITVLMLLCAAVAGAEQAQGESFSLGELHYSVPEGWERAEGKAESATDADGERMHRLSADGGALGGAVVVSAVHGDNAGIAPAEFYSQCYDEIAERTGKAGRLECVEVSGHDAAIVYADGAAYDLGESASATLVLMLDDCAYKLAFCAGTGSADGWHEFVSGIRIGEDGVAFDYASAPVYKAMTRGSKGDDVTALQSRLAELGYLSGSADGEFGAATEAAVKAYQQAAGLPETGKCDLATHESITGEGAPVAVNAAGDAGTGESEPAPYIGNANTLKFHKASCSSVDSMNEANKVEIFSREDAIARGYGPCKRCKP
ncbi:MAG: peptidoglycan-binding domain-containing protein [Candidatus Fimadaptatus sp.]|jgi:hypothetical protein